MNSGSELKIIQETFLMNQNNVKELEMQIFKTKENSKAMNGEKENQLENLKL